MLNPVHLRTLQTVVRCQSIKAAANRLGYSASAVSQQISALERSVGVTLFERSARSIRPTPAAHLLAQRTAEVVTILESAQREAVSAAASGRRRIALGLFPSAATCVLPAVLRDPAWMTAGTDLSVEVFERSALIERLARDQDLDLVLTYKYDHTLLSWPATYTFRPVGDDPLVVAVPDDWPFATERTACMSDLASEPWISHTPGTSAMLTLNHIWLTAGFSPRVVARCDDYGAVLQMVGAGLGAAIVPTMVLRDPPSGMTWRRPADLDAKRGIGALLRSPEPDPVVDLLLDALARHLHPEELEDRPAA